MSVINQNYKDKSHIENLDSYNSIYNKSIKHNDEFWSEVAERISWYKKWD